MSDPTPLPLTDTFEPTEAERAQLELVTGPNQHFLDRLKGPRENKDGTPLHPKAQFFLESFARPADTAEAQQAEEDEMATPEGRAAIRQWVDRNWALKSKATAAMAFAAEARVPGRGGPIPVRIYRPVTDAPAPLPVLVYFHGGGWLFGSSAAVDRAVRLIANEARVAVVSVDYRLAPEHVYPAAHDDAEDAWLWVRQNAGSFGGDPDLVAVGGDSAGGNLAIAVSLRQRAAGRPMPAFQLLYYPVTDMLGRDARSFALFGTGYGLDAAFYDEMLEKVFPDPASHASADVAPLRVDDLGGLPATLVATAGWDILRDQGRAFARRLEVSAVSVLYLNCASLGHGFMQRAGVYDDAERASEMTAQVFGLAVRSRPGMIEAG